MKTAIYVLNLDRHSDRLGFVADQLNAQGATWERVSGIDATLVSRDYLDKFVARKGPIPRMPDGARACTAGHYKILRKFLESDADHAVILEDDVILSDQFVAHLPEIISANCAGILNINRQTPTSGSSKSLIIKRAYTRAAAGYEICDLVGVHYGTAGYIIDRTAAQAVLDVYPRPNMPIDHVLFNPNLSRLFRQVPISQLFPALVKPREDLTSSIQEHRVEHSDRLTNKLKRLRAEVAIAPRLLAGLLLGVYKIKTLEFK